MFVFREKGIRLACLFTLEEVLGSEPRASCMLGMCSATEPCPPPRTLSRFSAAPAARAPRTFFYVLGKVIPVYEVMVMLQPLCFAPRTSVI